MSEKNNNLNNQNSANILNSRTAEQRRYVTEKPKLIIETAPRLDQLINDALSIIGSELARYRSKADKGLCLDLKEARAVQGYMESLVKMSKEARESQEKAKSKLDSLSDQELIEMIKKETLKTSDIK